QMLRSSSLLHFFSVQVCGDRRLLHSFPTRRSSDLLKRRSSCCWRFSRSAPVGIIASVTNPVAAETLRPSGVVVLISSGLAALDRSEEHTSELQSLTNLVCRLLLDKKKRTRPPYPSV